MGIIKGRSGIRLAWEVRTGDARTQQFNRVRTFDVFCPGSEAGSWNTANLAEPTSRSPP
jgi:hypothetical protein